MFDCIILDDDDDIVMVESPAPQQAKKSTKFEKRLITEVRRHPIIFDNQHKFFANVAKKDFVWQKIANKLKMDVDVCKTSWIELRYKYQSYVRRLRSFFLHPQKKKQQRPTMDFEKELMFLWRFVENSKYCAIPYEIDEPPMEEGNAQVAEPTAPAVNVDDDLILIEQPVELIIIDEDDDTNAPEKAFHITPVMKTLVIHIKKYPELYDSKHALFADYSRKSFVWNTIANVMGHKATKLMKCWIIMETRCEWEVSKNQRTGDGLFQTELEKIMLFFQPYIMANPNTVYKSSFYLKQAWYEPMDYFKDLYNLIDRMKRVPDIVHLTDSLLKKPEKTEQFFSMWGELAKNRNCSVGQCETTWLIMYHFYWELMKMRKQNYRLTDKWYFEITITELYEVVKDCKLAKQAKRAKYKDQRAVGTHYNKSVLNGNVDPRSTIPMVILHNPAVQQTKTMQTHPAKAMSRTTTPGTQQGPLPIITSAISLAPQAMTGARSQIRPVGGKATQNIVLQPKTAAQVLINNGQSQVQVNMPRAQLANIATPVAKASLAALNENANETQRAAATGNATEITITKKRTKMNINMPTQSTTTAVLNQTTEAATQEAHQGSMAPLPYISGIVSLLNPNQILIELISSQNGNHLVVHGPPLSKKYNLSMDIVAKFIREILAIPLLHNKQHNQPAVINRYWEHISKLFNLPSHICRACWKFLLENFTHLPQIAPLKELMKPFNTSLKVWTESSALFTLFDAHANTNGWLAHISRLPEVVEYIGTYPVLYKDVGKNANDTNTDMEALCAWRTIALRFPTISEISSIWTAFKNVFCQYMSDIEFGIDNKWHINWWRVFARLKFLVEVRYTSDEPYYYIVSNKMVEEIERCAMIEMKKRYCKDSPEVNDGIKKPFITEEMIFNGRRLNVEMVGLLTAIEKYPIICQKGDCLGKYEAWDCVAKELQMDVTDCLLAFRHACQKYCTYRRQDSISRCPLSRKYYKRFDTIFRTIKTSPRIKLKIRTPFELNQMVDDGQDGTAPPSPMATTSTSSIPGQTTVEDLVFPERDISKISMSNCESNLVVKNWMYAMGNLPTSCNEQLHLRLRNILKNYLPPGKSQTE